MASFNISQDDIYLLKTSKIIHVKAYLLNENNLIVDELSGYITSGDSSEDSSSDIRRSCNFSLHSYDESYDIGEYNRIWLKNKVRIDLGFQNFDQIYWYTKGIYVFDSCNYTYDGSTKDISFQCSDLVNTINGTHGGIIIGQCPYCNIPLQDCEEHRGKVIASTIKIEGCALNEETGLYEGNDIKKVVEDILVQNGITEFRVSSIGQVSCLQGYAVNWKENRIDTGSLIEEVERDENNGYDDLKNDHGTWHMIPYDLEFDTGTTLWDILVKIRDLYPGYEMYFDKDGVFVFQLIPICHHEMDVLDHTQFEGLVISESSDIDLTSVRNATWVYGQSIETDRYSEEVVLGKGMFGQEKDEEGNITIAGTEVNSVIPEFDTLFAYKGDIVVGILFPESIKDIASETAYMTINDQTYPLVLRKAIVSEDENGEPTNLVEYINYTYESFNTEDMYCFKYLTSKKLWVYAGMYQIEGYCENNDPNSPFSIDKIGYRLQILQGGEYEDITTSTLATERAEYENWLKSRLIDTVTLETVIIPFLEANQKIEYRKLSDGSIDSYIIKSLSYSFTEGTMTITMMKFYELDPFIVCS